MNENTTRNLSKVLENVDNCFDGDGFVNKHAEDQMLFHEYYEQLIRDKGIDKNTVVHKSGISKNYIYNILSGSKTKPGRDKVIALCVAACATYKETQRALEICNLAPLYPRNERDIRIAVYINKAIGDVTALNILLDEYGLTPLDV